MRSSTSARSRVRARTGRGAKRIAYRKARLVRWDQAHQRSGPDVSERPLPAADVVGSGEARRRREPPATSTQVCSRAAAAVGGLAWIALLVGCAAPHHGRFTFAQLTTIARGIPTPAGVATGRQTSGTSVNGTTGGEYREVQIPFTTNLDCPTLRSAWEAALRAAHRSFVFHDGPAYELHYIEILGSQAGITVDLGGYTLPGACNGATLIVSER